MTKNVNAPLNVHLFKELLIFRICKILISLPYIEKIFIIDIHINNQL